MAMDQSRLQAALASALNDDALAATLSSLLRDSESDQSSTDTALALLATISATEIGYVDGVTAGTVAASKAVVVDASKIISGLQFPSTARTATSDGLTTGTIADAGGLQFITVTSADANNIIVLPTPTAGTIVILRNGATGYELRSSATATVAINGGTGSAGESAIAASTMVIAVCTTATTWQAIGLAGTTLAAVEAAAN